MAGAQSIVLIGAGRMGGALASGWLSGRAKPNLSIVAPRPTPQVREWAEAGQITLNPEPAPADIVVLGIKPQQFARAAEGVKEFICEKTLVVSVMGGVKLSQLEDRLGTPHVIRAMPNTASRRIGIGVVPAWESWPVRLASYQRWPWAPVTMPITLPSASSTGPCSIWASKNAAKGRPPQGRAPA